MKISAVKIAVAGFLSVTALTGCATRTVIVARPGPPIAGVVIAGDAPRGQWVPGHWVWRPYWGRYVWVRGHWR